MSQTIAPPAGGASASGYTLGTTSTNAATPAATAESDSYELAPDSPAGWDLVWHGAFFDIVVLAGLVALLDTDESWSLRGSMLGVAILFARGLAWRCGKDIS